jgi:hypothetical protein
MSQAYGQTSLRHTAKRIAKIFLTISLNTVKVLTLEEGGIYIYI